MNSASGEIILEMARAGRVERDYFLDDRYDCDTEVWKLSGKGFDESGEYEIAYEMARSTSRWNPRGKWSVAISRCRPDSLGEPDLSIRYDDCELRMSGVYGTLNDILETKIRESRKMERLSDGKDEQLSKVTGKAAFTFKP